MKKFSFLKAKFAGDPNVGLYGFATDKYCILGFENRQVKEKIEKTLNVPVHITRIGNTQFAGLFAAGNSNGIIVSNLIDKEELKILKKVTKNVVVLKTANTAIGNLILCNDKGAYLSEMLKRHKQKISDVLSVEVAFGKIGAFDIPGSAAIASNKGCLCHHEITEEQKREIEELLKVKLETGTVSHGSPFVKSGLLVNSYGVVAGESSTGYELGVISETFGGV